MLIGFASADRFPGHMMTDGLEKWGGSGWARIGQYIQPLSEQFDLVVGSLFFEKDHFCLRTEDYGREIEPDVLVLQRYMHDTLTDHISQARAAGQFIINDVDDWYWGLDPSNKAFLSCHPKHNPTENFNHYRKVIGASDLVMVSTPFLEERMREINPNIVRVPNYVDTLRFYDNGYDDSDTPLVGWAGSTDHRSGDLEILRGIITPMWQRGEIKIQHSGHVEGHASFAAAIGAPEDAVEKLNLVEARDYPSILTMDVGIAPLRDVLFNHAKSEIKLLEYSASGIPWVASPLSAYSALQQELGIGRLAKKPQHWINHLRALRDPDTRREEGLACRKAISRRDIQHGVEHWTRILSSIG